MGESSGLLEPENRGGGGEHLCYPRWEGGLKRVRSVGGRDWRGRARCFLCGPSKPSVAMDGDLRHHWNRRTVSSLLVVHLPLSGETPD